MKDDQGDGLTEGRGGFLGLLDVLAHVGCEPWRSRGPRRAPVATILRWATAHAGTIGGLEWTGIGLHTLHARPVRAVLGCSERYRTGGHGRPHVSWGPSLTASQTAFGHCLIHIVPLEKAFSTNPSIVN